MNLKTLSSYIAVIALVVTLGFAASGTAFAQTTTNTAGVTNYANTTTTTTSTTTANGTAATTTSNLNLFIFGVNGANPSGTSGSVLGASTVGLPNTGAGGEATATWTIIAAFLLVLATIGLISRKNA